MFKYKTLRDLVYDYIGQQLRAGVINPTSTIKETALSEELSISRTPVREALIQLAGEGLLESVPHKGFYIRTLTETEAQELFVVIGHLEGLAARLSLGNIQEQDIAAMKMHISMMNAAIMADCILRCRTNSTTFISTSAPTAHFLKRLSDSRTACSGITIKP